MFKSPENKNVKKGTFFNIIPEVIDFVEVLQRAVLT